MNYMSYFPILSRWAPLCIASLMVSTAFADDLVVRPVMSAPYEVASARVAMGEIKTRWDAAQIEQQNRFAVFEGDFQDFVRSDPIMQDVTWPYDTCTDLISLIPPPNDGWGLRSDASFTQNPVDDVRAQVGLVTYDLDLSSDHPDFYGTERSVFITLSAAPENRTFWEMAMNEPALRAASFKPGPYNYPIGLHDGGVLLGDVFVRVSGTDEADSLRYLEQMIGCAIQSNMIADGVDPSTLRETP